MTRLVFHKLVFHYCLVNASFGKVVFGSNSNVDGCIFASYTNRFQDESQRETCIVGAQSVGVVDFEARIVNDSDVKVYIVVVYLQDECLETCM